MPRGCFAAHRVAVKDEVGVVSSANDDTALVMAKDKVFFSLGPLLGAGASSCVLAVAAKTVIQRIWRITHWRREQRLFPSYWSTGTKI